MAHESNVAVSWLRKILDLIWYVRSFKITSVILVRSTCSEVPKRNFHALRDNFLCLPIMKCRLIREPAGLFEEMLRVSNIEMPISWIPETPPLVEPSFSRLRSKETRTASHRVPFRPSPGNGCSCCNPSPTRGNQYLARI